VVQGTYYVYDTSSEDTVQLMPFVEVYGGFDGTETLLTERDWVANVTILDGHDSTNTSQVYHVVTGEDDAVIDGFTITGGNADGANPNDRGGGIYNSWVSPQVANCLIADSFATLYGGGVFNTGSTAEFFNCRFTGNSASSWGGAVINASNSTVLFENCLFNDNSAPTRAGGIYNIGGSSPTLTNVTFSGNSSATGGAIYNATGCSPTLTNCILWADTATTQPEIYNQTDATPVVTYSNIAGGYAGVGNIDADPLFVDGPGGDLHLQAGSPCIDAANGPWAPEFDLDGNPREDDTDSPNSGFGPPWADMGAYEYQP
jgi:predicted outer membrane repeat protein